MVFLSLRTVAQLVLVSLLAFILNPLTDDMDDDGAADQPFDRCDAFDLLHLSRRLAADEQHAGQILRPSKESL
jgi:hypothetical protein